MNNTIEQGNGQKLAGTQEMFTAQNSANQSYFNGYSQEKLNAISKVLSNTYSRDGGLQLNAGYFQNYLEMVNKFVQGARMGQDKKNMVLNAFCFVFDALLAADKEARRGPWEHTAQSYYPDDLAYELDEANGDDEAQQELYQAGLQEIADILTDFDADDGEFVEGSWDDAKEVIQEYIDVLEYIGFSIPDWVFDDMNDIDKKW
jgi:hypothetical protein